MFILQNRDYIRAVKTCKIICEDVAGFDLKKTPERTKLYVTDSVLLRKLFSSFYEYCIVNDSSICSIQ